MVFPWTRRPGSLIEITVEKTDYLRWLTFPFIDAMLNMMPVLPRRCATKGDFGMDLHGGAVFSAAIAEFLLHRGGDRRCGRRMRPLRCLQSIMAATMSTMSTGSASRPRTTWAQKTALRRSGSTTLSSRSIC